MSDTPPSTRDKIIADAQSLPDLIASAEAYDPILAKTLTGKALVASKSVWGPVVGAGVTWIVTKYGIGWDANLCAEVSGAIVLIVSAVIRSVTAGPIVGIFSKGSTP